MSRKLPPLTVYVACLTALALGCAQETVPLATSGSVDGPNILVVVLDACRPDRLGCYGYEYPTSPAIDELARDPDAVVFRKHYVQGAWTKTSTASLFTGLFAFQHGVLAGHTPHKKSGPGSYTTQILGAGFETMAERLRDLGYYTFGISKSRHLMAKYGFAQGFDEFFTPDETGTESQRVKKTLQLAGKASRSARRFFGYLHLNACHHPFRRDERHRGFMETYGFDYDERARAELGIDFTDGDTKHRILDREISLSPEDVRFLGLVYDAKLRHVDENYVAPLMAGIKDRGLYDDTLIVVTADHGEELYEHRGYAHGHALWDEVIRVPLIVKFPKGTRPEALEAGFDSVTQSIDLLPSFLALAGQPPPEQLPGSDIFGGVSRGFAHSQTKRGWALIHEGYKLIREDGSYSALVHLETDPAEQHDVQDEQPDRVRSMQAILEALEHHVSIRPVEAPEIETALDEQAVESLRSLGYLK